MWGYREPRKTNINLEAQNDLKCFLSKYLKISLMIKRITIKPDVITSGLMDNWDKLCNNMAYECQDFL
jgi:hypothetical protein